MHIGIRIPSPKPTAFLKPSFAAKLAEKLGFESVWFPEHPVVPVAPMLYKEGKPHDPQPVAHFPDPFVSLSYAAAATSNIKIGTGICLVPEHNPLVLAKTVSTLDRYSDGRLLFGIGAGWVQQESELMGVNFKRRWSQTREAVHALKALWTMEEAEYHGEFYDFPPVWCNPKPAQKPHPPILIGANSYSAIKRVVEWGDEWMPYDVPPSRVEEGRRELETVAAEMGRDISTLKITMWAVVAKHDAVRSYFDAGADRVVIHRPNPTNTEAELAEDFERIAEEVLR